MADQTWMQKNNVTPAKLVLIGVLAAIFLIVVAIQFAGGTPAATNSIKPTRGRPHSRPVVRTNDDAADKPTLESDTDSRRFESWKTLPLKDVVQHDPFGLPKSIVERIEAEIARENAAELKEMEMKAQEKRNRSPEDTMLAYKRAMAKIHDLQVGMVVSGEHGKAATIGSRIVRVGDTIEGFLIKDIRPDGVILQIPEP